MAESSLRPDESVETLGSGVELIISPEHSFGTDALLLADFASPKRRDLCIDLGTGCGILPLLFYRNGVRNDIYGLDIQERAVDQFTRSCERSRADNVKPLLGDFKDFTVEGPNGLKRAVPLGMFQVVTMNPPYKMAGRGILSKEASDQTARHETSCTLNDVCAAAAKLLNFGGRFCLCNRPERLADAMEACRAYGLEPKRLRMVQKNAGSRPWLFLLEGRLGGKPFLDVLPPLLIQDESGQESDELLRILGEYREPENQEETT